MAAFFCKQLIQRDFLERGHAQNLQKSVEREFQRQPLLDDGDERVNCDRHPDLRPHSVPRCPIERLDPQVLFDPTEEQFDLPAKLVELGDGQGGLKKVVRQVDRGGIEGVNCVLEFQADVLVAVESTGFGDEDLGEIGVDAPVPHFVGIGQVVARDAAADAHMIEPALHGSQAGYDIAEAFPVSQLGEGQTEELVEARKSPDFVVSLITPDAFSKLVQWQKGHGLGEDGRLGIHRSLLDISNKKSADYTKSRSNRLRPKQAVSSVLCSLWMTFQFS